MLVTASGSAMLVDSMVHLLFAFLVCAGRNVSVRDLPDFSKSNCNVIEGPLVLHASHPPLNMLEVKEYLTPLTTIVEITSVLMVTGLEEGVESIGQILPNLAVIRGNPAYRAHGFLFGLRVYGNKYLKRVELNKLTHALGENNLVVFWDNRELNFYHTVDWNKISSSRKCALANKIDLGKCSAQCGSGDNRGCWNGSNEGCQTGECSVLGKHGLVYGTVFIIFVVTILVYNKNKPNCSTDIHGAFRNYSGSECLSFCTVGGMTKCVSCKNFYYNGMCVHECPSNTYKVSIYK